MERLEYYRSLIVPFDSGTMVYWAERHDGENFDIDPSDIPENAIVTDVTSNFEALKYKKTKAGFKPYYEQKAPPEGRA